MSLQRRSVTREAFAGNGIISGYEKMGGTEMHFLSRDVFYVASSVLFNAYIVSYFWNYVISVMRGWGWSVWGPEYLAALNLPQSWLPCLWGLLSVIIPLYLVQFPFVERLFCYYVGARKLEGVNGIRIREAMNIACSHAGLSPEQFNLFMKHDKHINGMAVGKRNVIITTGAAERLSIPDLAGVVAHELGHLVHKDTFYGMTYQCTGLLPAKAIDVVSFVGSFLFFLGKGFSAEIILILGYIVSVFAYVVAWVLRFPDILTILIYGSMEGGEGEEGADRYACEIGLGMYLYSALSIMAKEPAVLSPYDKWTAPHKPFDVRLDRILNYNMEGRRYI